MQNLDVMYLRPSSIEELFLATDSIKGSKVSFLAGGTDLWVDLRKGKKTADWVIDLKGLESLQGIEIEEQYVRIGALTSIHRLERDALIGKQFLSLQEACMQLGSLQVRNRATIGGNIGNAAPTADTASPLLSFHAKAVLLSESGEETIPIEKFWVGPGRNCLKEGQILAAVKLPVRTWGSSFYKVGPRHAMDIAILSAAAAVSLDGNGCITDVGLAFGGAASVPLRAGEAEEYLKGRKPSRDCFVEAGRIAAQFSNPRDSSRASRAYRMELIPVLAERTLTTAVNRLGGIQI